MKIKEVYDGFNGFINVGHHCIFIVFDNNGIDVSPKKLAENVSPYSRAVLLGNSLADKPDLKDFVSKTIKQNKDFYFEIYVDGSTKPMVNMFPAKNIEFIFPLDIAKEYDDANIAWFKSWHAKFVISVKTTTEMNIALTYAQRLEIPKGQIWLDITNSDLMHDIMKQARVHGVNVAPRLREWLWENIGGNDGDSSQ